MQFQMITGNLGETYFLNIGWLSGGVSIFFSIHEGLLHGLKKVCAEMPL
jgi:hypothetical protein